MSTTEPTHTTDDYEREAYLMGWKRGARARGVLEMEGVTACSDLGRVASQSLEGLKQTATFANNVAPTLRQLAGCEDPMGVGTYQHRPTLETNERVNEAIDAFGAGYLDRVLDRTKWDGLR